MVTNLSITLGETVTLTWSEPDPPHGRILYYNILIIDQQTQHSTVISEYNKTSITKSALIHGFDFHDKLFISCQVHIIPQLGTAASRVYKNSVKYIEGKLH